MEDARVDTIPVALGGGRGTSVWLGGTYVPSHETQFPRDGTYFPRDGMYFPRDGTYFPSGGTYFPSDGTYFPSDETYFRSDGTYFTSDGTYFPSDGTYFPSDGRYFPTGAFYARPRLGPRRRRYSWTVREAARILNFGDQANAKQRRGCRVGLRDLRGSVVNMAFDSEPTMSPRHRDWRRMVMSKFLTIDW